MSSKKERRAEAVELLMLHSPNVAGEHTRRLLDPETTNREFANLVGHFYKAAGLTMDVGEAKEPHEMTAEEIVNAIDALERQALTKAKPVAALPKPAAGAFD